MFYNFLFFYDCIRTNQAECCICLEIVAIKRSTCMIFFGWGGGGVGGWGLSTQEVVFR